MKRGPLVPALLVVLVVATLLAAMFFYRLGHFDEPAPVLAGTTSHVDASDRSKAVATAEQFSLRMDQIDGSDLKGYTDRVLAMLTTKGKADFRQQFESLQRLQVDPSTKGAGRILASGVSEIDSDSATVLVAHDSATTTTKGSSGRHYRWSVSLKKVGGSWRVDDFTQVE